MEILYNRWKTNKINTQKFLQSIQKLDKKYNEFLIVKNLLSNDSLFYNQLSDLSLFKIWYLFYISFQENDQKLFITLLNKLDDLENLDEFLCIVPIMIKEFPASELLGKLCIYCLENFFVETNWIIKKDFNIYLDFFYIFYKYSIPYSDSDTRLTILIFSYESCDFNPRIAPIIFKCLRKDKKIKDQKVYFLKSVINGYDKIPYHEFETLSLVQKKKLFKQVSNEILNPYSMINEKIKSVNLKKNILIFLKSLIPKPRNVQRDEYYKIRIQEILQSFLQQLYDPKNPSFYSFNDLFKMAHQIYDTKTRDRMVKKINTVKYAIDLRRF